MEANRGWGLRGEEEVRRGGVKELRGGHKGERLWVLDRLRANFSFC